MDAHGDERRRQRRSCAPRSTAATERHRRAHPERPTSRFSRRRGAGAAQLLARPRHARRIRSAALCRQRGRGALAAQPRLGARPHSARRGGVGDGRACVVAERARARSVRRRKRVADGVCAPVADVGSQVRDGLVLSHAWLEKRARETARVRCRPATRSSSEAKRGSTA
jgi:hypothetical protein